MQIKPETIFRYVLAATFIVSALSKIFPIQSFELIIVSQGIASWKYVGFLSRFIIGFEFIIGILLLQNGYTKKLILPFAGILLTAFSVHLIYSLINFPSSENCGCFGELIPMSPMEALIKNIILLVLTLYAIIKLPHSTQLKLTFPLGVSLLLSVLVVILNNSLSFEPVKPVELKDTTSKQNDSVFLDSTLNKPLQNDFVLTDTLSVKKNETPPANEKTPEKPEDQKEIKELRIVDTLNVVASEFRKFSVFNTGTVNLDQGLTIVGVFSLDCDHCMATAKILGELTRAGNFPPVYCLFFGQNDQIEPFWQAAQTTFPYQLIEPDLFFPLLQNSPPRVVYLINGTIFGDWDMNNFSKDAVLKVTSQFR